MKWLLNFLIWLDEKRAGDLGETLPGRCHKRQASGCRLCKWLCRMLHTVDRGHCKKAYFADRLRNPNLPWV